ncbi:enterobactin exporter EntS [mine drainage metagenome]|uniref:Enterobactin exporter EntS n=1 Tax=mine drainage metagenome TaxID=410659 RepID=A0A1J5R108_9ZZZZ
MLRPFAVPGSGSFPLDKSALAARLAGFGSALRHRNYRLFFFGQLISLTGTWMQTAALSWLVYRLTGSAELLGLTGFAAQGPVFFLAPLGGALADRHPRRPILLATQSLSMLQALILAALVLSGHIQIWQVFVLAGAVGVVNAFDIPTRQAFLVEMVGHDDLPNAIALNSSMFNMARLLGPAVAGLLVAALGEGWCFLLNGLSYIAVIAGLLAMRLGLRRAGGTARTRLRDEIGQGLGFTRRHGPIRRVLLLLGGMSLMGMPYVVLLPIFASRILGGGPQHLGLLMSSAGLGALLGALALAGLRNQAGIEGRIAGAGLLFGLSLIAFGYSTSFPLSLALLLAVGFFQMTHMASSNTLIQALVPDAYRGRVMALYSMMFMGMAPFGALLSGDLADRIGPPATIAAGGALCMLGALVYRFRPGAYFCRSGGVAATACQPPGQDET